MCNVIYILSSTRCRTYRCLINAQTILMGLIIRMIFLYHTPPASFILVCYLFPNRMYIIWYSTCTIASILVFRLLSCRYRDMELFVYSLYYDYTFMCASNFFIIIYILSFVGIYVYNYSFHAATCQCKLIIIIIIIIKSRKIYSFENEVCILPFRYISFCLY